GLEQPAREPSGADLLVQLPDDPGARQLADDERRQEVPDELARAEATHRLGGRDRRPEREAHERHRHRQHPDDHLGAVGHALGEADADHGGERPERRAELHGAAPGALKSSRMTSSSGGSSTVRSLMSSSASNLDTASRSRSSGTWTTARVSSNSTTDPMRS